MSKVSISTLSFGKKIFYLIAFLLVAFCLYGHAYFPPSAFVSRGVYLGLSYILFFLIKYPSCKKLYDKVLFVLALIAGEGVCVYMILSEERIVNSWYQANNTDYLIILVYLVATFIMMMKTRGGNVISILALLGWLYLKFGHLLNNIFAHNLFSNTQIAGMLLTDTDKGAFGSLLGMAIRILSIFFIFASLLAVCGLGSLIRAIACYLMGKQRGGPAKIAVITSALFGMINGSAISNVVTTGSFTIPLMKQIGYKPKEAATIEAIASSGGGLMPPIMGVGAFIMAEIIGVPYTRILVWAIVPAFLWYWIAYWIVDHNAYYLKLEDWTPKWEELKKVIKEKWLIGLSVVVILYFLMTIQVAEVAAFWGVVTLIILSIFKKGTRLNFERLILFLDNFAEGFAHICIFISLLGVFTSALMSTGAHIKIGLLVFGGINNWFLVGMLVFLLCVLFGMVVPITAAYLSVVLIAVPVLVNFGVSIPITHMFVFYCCTLAPITPPVALAVVAASSLANSDPGETAWHATKESLPLWIIPFLLLKREVFFGMNTPTNVVLFWFALICLGGYIFTLGIIGNFKGRLLNIVERNIIIFSGLCILQPFVATFSIFGAILGILVIAYLIFKNKRFHQNIKTA